MLCDAGRRRHTHASIIKYMAKWLQKYELWCAYRNPFWSINADLTYAYYQMFDPFFFYFSICLFFISIFRPRVVFYPVPYISFTFLPLYLNPQNVVDYRDQNKLIVVVLPGFIDDLLYVVARVCIYYVGPLSNFRY